MSHHTVQARTLQSSSSTSAVAVRSLRRGIHWERVRTWHWQTAAGVQRSATIRGAAGFHSPGYLRWIEGRWNRRRLRAYRLAHRSGYLQAASGGPVSGGSVPQIICSVFGPYCSQALAVARCESGFSIWAENGQYVNIFQMGYNERRTYGWHVAGSPALIASQAAYRYFVASGRDWSPWSCKP